MSRKAPRVRATHIFVDDHGAHSSPRPIKLTAEQPLEVRQGGVVIYSLMRTPGHDIELIHGLLVSEGKIASKEDLIRASYCAGTNSAGENTYNVLDIALVEHSEADGEEKATEIPTLTVVPEIPAARNLPSLDIIHPRYLNSCGVCGTDKIAEVSPTLPTLHPQLTLDDILSAVDIVNIHEPKKAALPSCHLIAADSKASDSNLDLVVAREDVHAINTVYKCIGWQILNSTKGSNTSTQNQVAVTNARPTFEITKALAKAGIPALISSTEPTALAAELAQEVGMLLIHTPENNRFFVFAGSLDNTL